MNIIGEDSKNAKIIKKFQPEVGAMAFKIGFLLVPDMPHKRAVVF